MNMDYSYLIGPLLGGVIGYVTNDIAIRMMFRPHHPKYIFGMRIPFTPGIIPKERGRIAEAVGSSISENLMNREVLERSLLSPDMLEKIGNGFDRFVTHQKQNTETLRTFLHHYLPSDDIDAIQKDASYQLASLIHSRLADSEIGNRLAHAAVDHAIGKMENSLLGLAPGAGHFAKLLAEPAESLLAKHINSIIGDQSEEIVRDLIANEAQSLPHKPGGELLNDHAEQLQQLRTVIINAYTNVINTRLPRILKAIDISRIVRDRINDMDMQEAETIILSVMRRELRAIVWLGALLGTIIGTINALF